MSRSRGERTVIDRARRAAGGWWTTHRRNVRGGRSRLGRAAGCATPARRSGRNSGRRRTRAEWRQEAVGELDEHAVRPHQVEGVADQLLAPARRLVEERQTRDDRRDGLARQFGQRARQVVGVALDGFRRREAPLQHAAEAGIVFDQHEAAPLEAAAQKSPGDGSGPRPQLDDEAGRDIADGRSHCAGERPAGGRDRAGQAGRRRQRLRKCTPSPSRKGRLLLCV